MKRLMTFGAAALLAAPAGAAILYQSTVTTTGGVASFDDLIVKPSVIATGSTWIALSGGTIISASWFIDGEIAKNWWEIIGEDVDGNPEIYLNGNEYLYSNGCAVSPSTPICTSGPSFRSRLRNNIVRIDFIAPTSYDNCVPFNGIFNVDCAVLYRLDGARFEVLAAGTGDVTLTISDSRIAGAVPEPGSWALLIAGFGLVGAALRRRAQIPA